MRRLGLILAAVVMFGAAVVFAAGWWLDRETRRGIDLALATLPGGAVGTYASLDLDLVNQAAEFQDIVVLRDGRRVVQASRLRVIGLSAEATARPGLHPIARRVEAEGVKVALDDDDLVTLATLTLEQPALDTLRLAELMTGRTSLDPQDLIGLIGAVRAEATAVARIADRPATAARVVVVGLTDRDIERVEIDSLGMAGVRVERGHADRVTLSLGGRAATRGGGPALPLLGQLELTGLAIGEETEGVRAATLLVTGVAHLGGTLALTDKDHIALRVAEALYHLAIERASATDWMELTAKGQSLVKRLDLAGWQAGRLALMEGREGRATFGDTVLVYQESRGADIDVSPVLAAIFAIRAQPPTAPDLERVIAAVGGITGNSLSRGFSVVNPSIGEISIDVMRGRMAPLRSPANWLPAVMFDLEAGRYTPSPAVKTQAAALKLPLRDSYGFATRLELAGPEAGRRLEFTWSLLSPELAALDLKLFALDPGGALGLPPFRAAEALEALLIEAASLDVTDRGLLEAGLTAAGAQMNMAAPGVRLMVIMGLSAFAQQAGRGPASRAALDAVTRFLAQPSATLTTAFTPSRPMRIDAIRRAIQTSPADVVDSLNLQVTIKP
ncbi:MAG: hypothetical protein SF002_09785 [Alphaproteobacteria bacterium]|nr:hypothetical protein [Alphaproteobacteria bacterium]